MSSTETVNFFIEQADNTLSNSKIDVEGEEIAIIMFEDTTKLSLENLAKTYVDIDYEIYKLQLRKDKSEKMEIRRLFAFQKVIKRLMEDICDYRTRMEDKYPELLEKEG